MNYLNVTNITPMLENIFGIAPVLIISIIYVVLAIVGNWKVYVKLGEPGWKSIIPIYNEYVLFNRIWEVKIFFVSLVISIISLMLKNADLIYGFYVFNFISAIIGCVLMYKLGKAFNKSAGFIVGLILLPLVFTLILAFDSSCYNPNIKNEDDYLRE